MTKREELVKIRLSLGLTQAELPKRLGLGLLAINRLERGAMPQPSKIPKLASGYGLSVKEFVELLFKKGDDDRD